MQNISGIKNNDQYQAMMLRVNTLMDRNNPEDHDELSACAAAIETWEFALDRVQECVERVSATIIVDDESPEKLKAAIHGRVADVLKELTHNVEVRGGHNEQQKE